MTAPRRRLTFSLRTSLAVVGLAAVATTALHWSLTASWIDTNGWLIDIVFVAGTTSAVAAMGMLFGQDPKAAGVGAVIGLGSLVWLYWEKHIGEIGLRCRFSEDLELRYLFTFVRLTLSFVSAAIIALGAHRLYHRSARRARLTPHILDCPPHEQPLCK